MFIINDDKSIYITRGDAARFAVTAERDGTAYTFQPSDVVRFKVFEKKGCDCVVLQKDFIVSEAAESVEIDLTRLDTKIGDIIHKPKDLWYEVELNPETEPQTIIGYDEDGAKIFRLMPEGKDEIGGEEDVDHQRHVYEQMQQLVEESKDIAQSVRDDADNGVFDYVLTQEDKEEIAAKVETECADDEILKYVATNGIVAGDNPGALLTTPGNGLQTVTAPGEIIIDGITRKYAAHRRTWNVSDTERKEVFLYRLDRVSGEIEFLWRSVTMYGDTMISPADSAELPIRSDFVYDVLNCIVTIPANAETITADMIHDLREYAETRLNGGGGAVSSVNGKVGKVQLNAEDVGARAAITPQKYGAKGDGETDDTAAFQAALDVNRVVYVPGGTYKLSSGITIGGNCMLELSQDTVLVFTNESGHCINLDMSAALKGNHATIKVPYWFAGEVLYAFSGDRTEIEQRQVQPWSKWDPQWKTARYITDINICKDDGSQGDDRGFHYAVNPTDCRGTAVYMSADKTTGESSYMWGNHLNGIRIAGAFTYGIRAENKDGGWLNDMRIEAAYIDACEIGVSLEECGNVYVSASIQPRRAYTLDKVYKPYAKHGVQLIRSKNVDLSSTRVWDWNTTNTLWVDGGEYQHISMIGECRGAILGDFKYYEDNIDIRKLIHTDTESNLSQMTILQEPIDRWFRMREGVPYCNDGKMEYRLLTEDALDPYFKTGIIKSFTDVLESATDIDGVTVFNENGYKEGVRFTSLGIGTDLTPSLYYMTTGFISVQPGSVLDCNALSYADVSKTYAGIVYYDSNRQRVANMGIANVVNGTAKDYVINYAETKKGCTFKIASSATLAKLGVAYIRLVFPMSGVGSNPMIAIDESIEYTVEGFLADGVKVKGENVIGIPGQVKPDWVATKEESGGDAIVISEQTLTSGMWSGRQMDIEPGVSYDVYINDKRYTCVAFDDDGSICLGNNSDLTLNDYPFCVSWFGGASTSGMFFKVETLIYPISFKVMSGTIVVYNKMPEGYLPDKVVKSINGKTGDVQLDAEDVGALPKTTLIPSKISELQNDSGYLTQHQDLSGYAKMSNTLSGYGITDGATKTEVNQLSAQIDDETNNRENAIADLKAQGLQQTPLIAQGDTLEECLAWLDINGDKTKTYIMKKEVSEYVYAYMPGKGVAQGSKVLEVSWSDDCRLSTSDGGIRTGATGYTASERIDLSVLKNVGETLTVTGISFSTSNVSRSIALFGNGSFAGAYYPSPSATYPMSDSGVTVQELNSDQNILTLERVAECTDGKTYEIALCGYGTRANAVVTHTGEIEIDGDMAWSSTGHAFIQSDYEGRIATIETSNTTLKNENTALKTRVTALEDAAIYGDGVPGYVLAEAEEVADKVLAVRNADSFVMALASDFHTNGADTSSVSVVHAGQGMVAINSMTQLDLVALLGDYEIYGFSYGDTDTDVEDARKSFKHIKKAFSSVAKGVPFVQLQGNHDELPADTTEEARQKYYSYIGANNVGTVTDYNNKFRNYGYRDFENYKIRVIYLNTTDVSDSEVTDNYNVSAEQLNWLNTVALNLADTEWGIIVLSHHPLNWYGGTSLLNALDAYKGKGSGAELIAHFHGHLHNFRAETLGTNAIPTITIPNACFGRENEYGTAYPDKPSITQNYGDSDANGNQRLFAKTANSAEDTAFNVVVVDRQNRKIRCFNYGAGIDREISF